MKRTMLFVVLALCLGCAKAPPNLTPQGAAAFHGTQVIKALDVLRDTAIDANALVPPLVSTDTTRNVVTYHKSAITIIHATPRGWKVAVLTGLNELSTKIPPVEQQQLGPYLALAKTLIQEVGQ